MNAAKAEREQSTPEEIANSISHGIGFALAAAALAILAHTSAVRAGTAPNTLALIAFVASMMLLYLSSALFHALPPGKGKRFFERLDRSAIYVFIAGTYSAFAAPALHGNRAWSMLALVWAVASLGVLITMCRLITSSLWSTGLYVAMGWLALLAALPWIEQVSPSGVRLLLVGGFTYTLGAAVFLLSTRLRFAHLVWHLFVMAGSGFHLAAALSHS
jgi:hemolysin III